MLHHRNPGAEPVVFQHRCGADFHPLTVCADCLEPLHDGELTVTGGPTPSKQPCDGRGWLPFIPSG